MTSLSPLGGVSPHPSVEAFRDGAKQGEAVRIAVDGQSFKVLAEGRLDSADGSGRSVAWVEDDADTTGMFVQALSQGFGARVSAAVAKELGLAPASGKALSSRLVHQALEMAQTGQQALAGIDFITRLEHSAVAGGAAFQRAAAVLGIDPNNMGTDDRAMLDRQLNDRFEAALARGETPVSGETAAGWITGHLSNLKSTRP